MIAESMMGRLKRAVETHDLQALEGVACRYTYLELIEAAEAAGLDLDTLEEQLYEIS